MALSDLINNSTIEIFPDSTIESKISALPAGIRVAIATHDMKETRDFVKSIAGTYGDRYVFIPHIQARAVMDYDELFNILDEYWGNGIKEIFVVGGDIEDEGVKGYGSAYSLILDIKEWEASTGNKYIIGVTGYPEGHYKISDERLMQALRDKQPYVDYIATQLSLNSRKVIKWLKKIRDPEEGGIRLPVRVLVPAENDQDKLMKTIKRVDIKTSWRYLSHNLYQIQLFISDFIANSIAKIPIVNGLSQYIPLFSRDKFMSDLIPYSDSLGISGFHIFSANQIKKTNDWMQRLYN